MNQEEKNKYMSKEAKEWYELFKNLCEYDPEIDKFPYYGFKPAGYEPFITEEEL